MTTCQFPPLFVVAVVAHPLVRNSINVDMSREIRFRRQRTAFRTESTFAQSATFGPFRLLTRFFAYKANQP